MVFQNAQGRAWFYAVASFLPKKLVVEKRTRKYAFQQPAGVFCTRLVSAPSIFKRLTESMFYAMPLLKILNSHYPLFALFSERLAYVNQYRRHQIVGGESRHETDGGQYAET